MTTLSDLTAEYQIWTAANGYPEAGSADELLADVQCAGDDSAASWIKDFIARWEAATDAAVA